MRSLRKVRAVPLDPQWQEKIVAPYQVMLQEKNYAVLQATLEGMPREDRDVLYQGMGLFDGPDPQDWCNASPGLALAWCALGYHQSAQALQIGDQNHHARERSVRLAQRSREAFQEAVLLDPFDPLGYAGELLAGMMLPGDAQRDENLYRGAEAVDPTHYLAAHNRCVRLVERRGGERGRLLHFARGLQDLPDGATARGLLALAHIEQWAQYEYVEHSGFGDTYFQRPAVQEELAHAADMSILHPRHQLTWASYEVAENMAFAFLLGGSAAHARRVLLLLEERIGDYPWQYHPRGRDLMVQGRRELLGLRS